MVIFPSVSQPLDGLPHLSFVYENLRDVVKPEEKPLDIQKKYSRKPRVDMGIPKPQAGQENQARAGTTFDPKLFKGNVMLFKHLNEVSISMMKHKVEASDSIKKKKINNVTATENYGVQLLKEDQVHDRMQSDSEDDEVEKRVNSMLKLKDLITPQPSNLPKIKGKWGSLQSKVSQEDFKTMKQEIKQREGKSKSLSIRGLSFIDVLKQAIEKENHILND